MYTVGFRCANRLGYSRTGLPNTRESVATTASLASAAEPAPAPAPARPTLESSICGEKCKKEGPNLQRRNRATVGARWLLLPATSSWSL